MQSKNKLIGVSILSLVIGVLIGWLIWHGVSSSQSDHMTTHVMPDGTVMNQDGSMAMQMDAMTNGLAGKIGDEFDRAFLTEMIAHHEGAVAMANLVLKNSKRPEMIAFAHRIIDAQSGEIIQMKEWLAQWYR
ncbi:MAG: hypothetical protein JWM20_907 [Patescibacteria group bacterium]|nr:hypothetical protein [Patescibacteria group bacterium]